MCMIIEINGEKKILHITPFKGPSELQNISNKCNSTSFVKINHLTKYKNINNCIIQIIRKETFDQKSLDIDKIIDIVDKNCNKYFKALLPDIENNIHCNLFIGFVLEELKEIKKSYNPTVDYTPGNILKYMKKNGFDSIGKFMIPY